MNIQNVGLVGFHQGENYSFKPITLSPLKFDLLQSHNFTFKLYCYNKEKELTMEQTMFNNVIEKLKLNAEEKIKLTFSNYCNQFMRKYIDYKLNLCVYSDRFFRHNSENMEFYITNSDNEYSYHFEIEFTKVNNLADIENCICELNDYYNSIIEKVNLTNNLNENIPIKTKKLKL